MPFTPDSPENKDVRGPVVNKTLDKFHIHEIRIKKDPNIEDGITLDIVWTKGYLTDAGMTYNPVESHREHLEGAEVIAVANANTGGDSLYKEIKDAAWGLLQTLEKVPDGNIT